MKRLLSFSFIAIFTLFAFIANAQSYKHYDEFCQSIRLRDDVYYFGGGHGSTEEIAKEMALQELSESIFIKIGSNTSVEIGNRVKDQSATTETTTKSKIYSYSSAYVEGLSKRYAEKDGQYYCFVYVDKSEIEEQNQERIATIIQYMESAVNSEVAGNVGMALQTAYKAYSMLNCLSSSPETVFVKNNPATVFIPEFIKGILSNIDAKITGKVPGVPGKYNIEFTYKGNKVSDIMYEYFLNNCKNVEKVTNGNGVIDGLYDNCIDSYIVLKITYNNKNKKNTAGEEVMDYANCEFENELEVRIPEDIKKQQVEVKEPEIKSTTENNAILKVSHENAKKYSNIIKKVVSHIRDSRKCRTKKEKNNYYSAIKDSFSADGFSDFMKLIGYGTPTVLHNVTDLNYSQINGETYCRSVRMNFKFRNNESYTEDIVFKFNDEGKISGVSMSLGETAIQRSIDGCGILWDGREDKRSILINFLEDYRTAFALKDTTYLRSIFSPNALIIIGKKIRVYTQSDGMPRFNERVETQRMTTTQYMDRLKRIFDNSYNYINIRFSDYVVKRAENEDRDIYAVQIKQDYFSSVYDDSGYLFLYVDLTDPSQPIVHIRAWQEELDPEFGLLDEYEVLSIK